jgi:glycosyltransferase involved in cell wall biosynthesis
MNNRPLLSAIIIAKNESKRIQECINNLVWADEILLIDNGSTDDTVKYARRYKVTVIKEHLRNFSRLRNIGAKRAAGEWLLYVDADETVTPALRKEIIQTIHNPNALAGYVIPRNNVYLGHIWPHQDGMVRLMKKKSFVTWEGILHEHAIIRGRVGTLSQPFIHNTHRSLSEMVAKTNEWSDYEAKLRFDARHPSISWWRVIRVMCTAFFDSFIRQGGWKAGVVGWIESVFQAFSIFITYSKLWEMQNKHV